MCVCVCVWCSWFNGCNSMKWTQWPKFKSWMRLFTVPIVQISLCEMQADRVNVYLRMRKHNDTDCYRLSFTSKRSPVQA